MQAETIFHDLNDLTGSGIRDSGFEHRFMPGRIEFLTNFRSNDSDAMLAENIGQFAQR